MKFGILILVGQAVSEKKIFENNGHMHVYSPGAGADNHLGLIYFHYQYYSFNTVLCCKFSLIKRFCNSVHHPNV